MCVHSICCFGSWVVTYLSDVSINCRLVSLTTKFVISNKFMVLWHVYLSFCILSHSIIVFSFNFQIIFDTSKTSSLRTIGLKMRDVVSNIHKFNYDNMPV